MGPVQCITRVQVRSRRDHASAGRGRPVSESVCPSERGRRSGADADLHGSGVGGEGPCGSGPEPLGRIDVSSHKASPQLGPAQVVVKMLISDSFSRGRGSVAVAKRSLRSSSNSDNLPEGTEATKNLSLRRAYGVTYH